VKAGIYVRISRDYAGEGLGVERQEQDCRLLADRLGWDVEDVYIDNDVSAFRKRKDDSQINRLVADLRLGRINAVLAWHMDRLHRDNQELLDYIKLSNELDFPTHCHASGVVDLTTPNGRAAAITLGAWARAESEHKAERLRSKHAQLRDSGKMVGARSFGWKYDTVGERKDPRTGEVKPINKTRPDLDPVESELVAEVAHRILAGESPYHLAVEMNERGFATTKGGPWLHGNLRLMLLNPKVAGFRATEGKIHRDSDGRPVVGQWEPILAPETWVSLVAVLNRKKRTRQGSTKHLLGGLVNCECGGVMYGSHVRATGLKNYTCRSCRTAISHDNLHPVVLRELAASVLLGPSEDSGSAGLDAALVTRIEALRRAQKNLLDLVDAEAFSLADVAAKKAALDKEIAEAESALGAQAAHRAAGNAVEALRRELWAMFVPDDAERSFFDEAAELKTQLIAQLEVMEFDRVRTLVENSLRVRVKRVGKGKRDPNRVTVKHLIATSLNDDAEGVA
jgi:DNA invertase Pin-like site-specific DNA recombinase